LKYCGTGRGCFFLPYDYLISKARSSKEQDTKDYE
jgi:hypothetical protein